ncbi:MAG: cation:proton antiporter, partial [Planctomycetota bacterium]
MLTLGAGGNSQVMLDLLILLAAAAGVSMIVGRLKIAPIAGYLIAGAIFGPNALGVIGDSASAASISQIAIVLLMFGIGLHLDRNDLRSGMLPTLGIGVVSTLFVAGLLTPGGLAFGLSMPASVAIAFALSMSSTAVVLRLLQYHRQLRQVHGQIAFGTLIAQDMIVVLVLALMPVLAGLAGVGGGNGEGFSLGSMLVNALLAIGGMTLLIVIGL